MLANQRQDVILQLLRENGAVTASNLVKTLRVSLETIRRDLKELENRGQLSRVHGGAVTKTDMKPFFDLDYRTSQFSVQKENLAQRAVEFISEGDVIAIDCGSTAIPFAESLKSRFSRLTVITYSYDIFHRLCHHADFTVLLCSGDFDRTENAFYGRHALQMMQSLHAQKAFIFPSAISLEHGIYDYQTHLYSMQMGTIDCADQVFILADSSKFEKTGLYKLADMEKSFTYITDGEISEQLLELYRENEIKIFAGVRVK